MNKQDMEIGLIEYLAKSLVDEPDQVSVELIEGEKSMILELRVAQDDVGKVIGKQGRIAKAMRTLLGAARNDSGKRYALEIPY